MKRQLHTHAQEYFLQCTQIDSKQNKNLSGRPRTTKLVEKNSGEKKISSPSLYWQIFFI